MGIRGRQSAAGAIALIDNNGVTVLRRPEPPEELTAEQADEWQAIVNRLPADWFPRETHAILANYCRHVVAARRIAELLKAAEADENFDLLNWDRLLKMQDRESRAMHTLGTGMRITQHATYDKKKTKPIHGGKKAPWEAA